MSTTEFVLRGKSNTGSLSRCAFVGVLFMLSAEITAQLPQQSFFIKIQEAAAIRAFQLSPDFDRVTEMKMLRANFPDLAPALDPQITAIYQKYVDIYFHKPANNRYGTPLQPPTGAQMVNFSDVPVTKISWEKKNREAAEKVTEKQAGYTNPSPENKFNQVSAQRKLEIEIAELLREAEQKSFIIGEGAYYTSPRYLNDLPNYIKAKNLIKDMLAGKQPLSVKEAYYFQEAAYGNLHLSYQEYNDIIKANTDFIRQWLKENGYNLKDHEVLHFGIQKFLSDTLDITVNGKKQRHIPYYYDFIDAEAKEDHHNYFITKTLATGSGQCHTFPVIYLIFAETLGVEAYLADNPRHYFIRYKNNKGTLVNYETTIDRFLPDAFYTETLPVMATAQRNTLYVNTLTKKQVVAYTLFDLAVNFIDEHWLADQTFIRECISIAAPCFPNQEDYINTSHCYLLKRLYADAFNSKVQEKGIKDSKDIEKYPDVLEAYHTYYRYMEKVSNLGIQDFPESEYLRLLEYYDQKGKLQVAKKLNAKTKKSLFTN